MMKTKCFLFLLSVVFYCFVSNGQTGEEVHSLNGLWKFNTFLGDGFNYLDFKLEQGDIIIDNSNQKQVTVVGKWTTKTVPERESAQWGKDYLFHHFKQNDTASVRFSTASQVEGYYEHFIFYPFSDHLATIVNVKHADGIYTKDFCQKNRPGFWLSLGIFKVEKGINSYVEITAATPGGTVADAVLLRPVDEQKFLAAEAEKRKVIQPDYNDSKWQELKVPGHFGMINKYCNYSGKGWYRKEIELPEGWKRNKDERIRLRFEAVYHLAHVYLNGILLGSHQGGFTPFEFDVTEHLNYSGKNWLAVEADNNYWVGATWNWGGIIRDVNLIRNKEVRVQYQYIHAQPNLQSGTADYTIKVRIENNSLVEKTLDLKAVVLKGKPINTISSKVTVAPQSIKEKELEGHLSADQVKLWHFDRPELYTLETSVIEGEKLLHKKTNRFGIRKFEANASQMLLNGEPVRLVGFNRVSDHRYWGDSEPQELINLDVDLMKTAGANFMRIMHGTQNPKLLDRCDEKGIFIFEEANIRDLRNPEFVPPHYARAKQWIREMIERDVNHPCIVGWSVGNELKDHFQYVKTTYEYAKQLDPYRMALHVSNQGYHQGESPANNPLQYGDMIFQNIYQAKPGDVMDTLHARWPNKAMFFSEFGVGRFTTPSLDNDIPGLADWYANLRGQRSYTTGASMWTFNDYKSGYSQSLPCGNRAWGIVNAWRTKRRSFYTYQNESSPAKKLTVSHIDLKNRKASVSILIRDADDMPSYTMKDYVLKYTFRTISGELLFTKDIKMPLLSPGMGLWQGVLTWGKLKGTPFELQVALVTPNGYTRRESRIHFGVPVKPVIDEVKTSRNKIRVHFTKTFDAFEYSLKYNVEGVEKRSPKTIANYLDLDSLPAGKSVMIQLIASNSKGDSEPSGRVVVKTEGEILAPIVWAGFIADNKLVVGYSGEWDDLTYTLRYGHTREALNQSESSNARGIMIVPLKGEKSVFFQIKRAVETDESQWSNVIEAKESPFNMNTW